MNLRDLLKNCCIDPVLLSERLDWDRRTLYKLLDGGEVGVYRISQFYDVIKVISFQLDIELMDIVGYIEKTSAAAATNDKKKGKDKHD